MTGRPTEAARPGLARRKNEPPIPEGVDSRSLHAAVRAELRSLPKDLAEIVAAHMVRGGQLAGTIDRARYAHAEAGAGGLPGCRSTERRQLKRHTLPVDTTLR